MKIQCAVYGLPTANFFADHPFIFSIMSSKKDVLFMGRPFKLWIFLVVKIQSSLLFFTGVPIAKMK